LRSRHVCYIIAHTHTHYISHSAHTKGQVARAVAPVLVVSGGFLQRWPRHAALTVHCTRGVVGVTFVNSRRSRPALGGVQALKQAEQCRREACSEWYRLPILLSSLRAAALLPRPSFFSYCRVLLLYASTVVPCCLGIAHCGAQALSEVGVIEWLRREFLARTWRVPGTGIV
jgi:hypothetical protein